MPRNVTHHRVEPRVLSLPQLVVIIPIISDILAPNKQQNPIFLWLVYITIIPQIHDQS
jgi:hypothetical protein